MDIKKIADSWEKDKRNYQELGKIVHGFIKLTITECGILPEITFRPKGLLSIIKKIKKKQLKDSTYSYKKMNDKLGVRIICTFQEEMDSIDVYLRKYFKIKKIEKKRNTLDFKVLDYISNHYDVFIKPTIKEFSKYEHLKNLVFEIQVRTLNQHAWANTAHALSYKQEIEIPDVLNRRVYRLLSLYEIADDEFSTVNTALLNHKDNTVYTLLKILESSTFKYAKMDYDRDLSIYTLGILKGYLTPEQLQELCKNIEVFISNNEAKIKGIFSSNQLRFHEISILTQPEIFFIWYCLDKYPASINDNWVENFDKDELGQVTNLWGAQIG